MKTLLLALLFSLPVFAQEDVARELQRAETVQGTIARLEQFSKNYLGLPYGYNGPLGEGATGRYDQDPLWRFDVYDCTTYVETMISLAHSATPEEFQSHMREIRYERGVIDYFARNHFTSLQWIPNNIQNGYLKDITRDLVPASVIKVARALNDQPRHYRAKKLEELRVFDVPREALPSRLEEWQEEGSRLPALWTELDYIPVDWIVANPAPLARIPNGSVVNFVRPNWDLTASIGTHLNISHQGLIFQRAGKTWMRHASLTAPHTVREELFIDYLRKFVGHATLKGIHLMSVQ